MTLSGQQFQFFYEKKLSVKKHQYAKQTILPLLDIFVRE